MFNVERITMIACEFFYYLFVASVVVVWVSVILFIIMAILFASGIHAPFVWLQMVARS